MGVGTGLYMCDVVKKFTFAISSPDEFLSSTAMLCLYTCTSHLGSCVGSIWFYLFCHASM